MKLISSILLLLSAVALADLKEQSEWKVQKEQGGIKQAVGVSLGKLDAGAKFEAVVEWTPGTTVEVTAKITRRTKDRIEFTFEDSFGNRGKGTLISKGKTAELDFETTDLVEPRGARQLGPYTLNPSK